MKTLLNARVDNVFLNLKKKMETTTEFVERAMKALREKEQMDKEHELLVHMIKEFVKKRVKINLKNEHVELVKSIYNTQD